MLYNIIIAPIETIVEWVFIFICNQFSSYNIIVAVCGVSLVINFLALPLYNIADSLQEKERKVTRALEPRVKRIKKAFKGDEQFMMLSEYYRQNNYHPLYVLRSSLSILIEIPFFIAAYHYLSNCEKLMGAAWWIFSDLGAPDSLFSFSLLNKPVIINVLPILMTLINFVSGAIYCKDAPVREKVQLYGIALVFLVLLYNSPSGLVIYWILNNLFSLGKNIVMKMKKPGRILHISITVILFLLSCYFSKGNGKIIKKLFIFAVTLFVALLPLIGKLINRLLLIFKFDINAELTKDRKKVNFVLFFFSCLGMAILTGYLLTSSIVSTSPEEFSFIGKVENPVHFVNVTFYKYLGLFVLWPTVIYFMFGNKIKKVLSPLFFIAFIMSLLHVYVFKHDYGDLNVLVQIEQQSILFIRTKKAVLWFVVLPIIISCLLFILYLFLVKKNKLQLASTFVIALCCAEFVYGTQKVTGIKKEFKQIKISYEQEQKRIQTKDVEPVIHLSKNDKNVFVFFLDRAINVFFPYALEQFPQLKDQFKGFTYYPNALSYSIYTITGAPPLMGGYEYTPEGLNSRPDELLKDKHHEATMVMPKLFTDAGYQATLLDPPWANYSNVPDYVEFENEENLSVSSLRKVYKEKYLKEKSQELGTELDKDTEKGFRDFTFLEILIPGVRNTFMGNCSQKTVNYSLFADSYPNLYYLPQLTDFTAESNTYTFIDNETIHNPQFMNEDYDFPSAVKVNHENQTYKCKDDFEQKEYEVFCAAILKVGEWMEYLQENDVYDNTRIVLVSDHGYHIPLSVFDYFDDAEVPSSYSALLMYKDFDSKEPLKTDDTFMTNADTLFLAKEGLDVSNTNPYTGKVFTQEKENGVNIYPITAHNEINADDCINKYVFESTKKSEAWHVQEDVYNPDNWIPLLEWEEMQK